jgi:hypothetical protein
MLKMINKFKFFLRVKNVLDFVLGCSFYTILAENLEFFTSYDLW